MKKLCYIILIALLASCGGAETKVAVADKNEISGTDTTVKDNTRRPADEKIPGNDKDPAAKTNTNKTSNEILANIDQYLISRANFPEPPPSGGISNASVTIQNTLPDISFQKAIVEVSIRMANGAEFRTDYFVLQNIEPSDLKTIKIPNASRGTTIVCHIVKLKSEQLTKGEMILVGDHFIAQ